MMLYIKIILSSTSPLVPSILIGLVEVLLRPTFPDGSLGLFSVFLDLCNDLNYILCFLLGFSLTAADGAGMKEIIRNARWINLIVGKAVLFL